MQDVRAKLAVKAENDVRILKLPMHSDTYCVWLSRVSTREARGFGTSRETAPSNDYHVTPQLVTTLHMTTLKCYSTLMFSNRASTALTAASCRREHRNHCYDECRVHISY